MGSALATERAWPSVPLGELVENLDSARVPVKAADRRPGPYPYYGASGVVDHVDDYLFDGEYLLVAEDGENLRTRKTPVAFMARGKFWVNNHAHILRGNDRADTRFLMYALSRADVGAYLTGSTQPKLTQGALRRIRIVAPPLSEQRRIANTLGALDDKIELNRRMNDTLESIARTIFGSWFVDFDPAHKKIEGGEVGLPPDLAALWPAEFTQSEMGPIPRGWRAGSLGDIADVVDCLHAKKPARRDAGHPLLQLFNIRDNGLLDLDEQYLIGHEDYAYWTSRFEARAGDCVITNVGRVGAVAQVPKGMHAALGRNMTGIRCKPGFPYPTWLLQALLSSAMKEEVIRNTDTGTILQALNVRSIPRLRVILPPTELLTVYEVVSRPIRRQMEDGLRESAALADLRASLLPDLMSGRRFT